MLAFILNSLGATRLDIPAVIVLEDKTAAIATISFFSVIKPNHRRFALDLTWNVKEEIPTPSAKPLS